MRGLGGQSVCLHVCCWFHLGIDSLALDHSVTPSLPSQLKIQGCPRAHCTAITFRGDHPAGRATSMPPKKKNPTSAAASSPVPAAGQAVAMDVAFVYSSDCNAHLTVRIKDALSTVDGADVFHDLTAALPLGISDSGVQAPFCKYRLPYRDSHAQHLHLWLQSTLV